MQQNLISWFRFHFFSSIFKLIWLTRLFFASWHTDYMITGLQLFLLKLEWRHIWWDIKQLDPKFMWRYFSPSRPPKKRQLGWILKFPQNSSCHWHSTTNASYSPANWHQATSWRHPAAGRWSGGWWASCLLPPSPGKSGCPAALSWDPWGRGPGWWCVATECPPWCPWYLWTNAEEAWRDCLLKPFIQGVF